MFPLILLLCVSQSLCQLELGINDPASPENIKERKIIRADFTINPDLHASVGSQQEMPATTKQRATLLFNRGADAIQKNNYKAALNYFLDSLEVDPSNPQTWDYASQIMQAMQKLDIAISYSKMAISLEPKVNVIFETNLANLYLQKRNAAKTYKEQEKYLQLTCKHFIQGADATHKEERLKIQAARCFRELGKPQEALLEVKKAIRISKNDAEVYVLLGHVYKDLVLNELSLEAYHKALTIEPKNLEAIKGLGILYQYTFFKLDQAAHYHMQAIEGDPNDLSSLHNLASVYNMAGLYSEAIEKYKEVLKKVPNAYQSWIELLNLKKTTCDWSSYDEDLERLHNLFQQEFKTGQKSLLSSWYAMNFPLDPAIHKQIAINYAKQDFLPYRNNLKEPFKHAKSIPPGQRLKVGIVTADAGATNVGHDIVGWFIHNDESESGIELHLYVTKKPDNSLFYKLTKQYCGHVHDIHSMTPEAAAIKIHKDEMHILINLNGYTKWSKNEIFAQQPSPIQINFKGYPGTLGADWHQYTIGDRISTPLSLSDEYYEKLIILPNCYFMASYPTVFGHIVDPVQQARFPPENKPKHGLPTDKFIFANFNHLPKVDPKIFSVWMKILTRVPDSILWLLKMPPEAEKNLKMEAQKRGVNPNRLVFTALEPIEDHLSIKGYADLFIDTLVFNGHGTGMDILWAGVPVLSITGKTFQSRTGRTYATVLGVTDLIMESLEEYEEKAVELATDQLNGGKKLADIRTRVRESRMTSPLFDTKRWVRDWQVAMEMIWDKYEKDEKIDHVIVPDNGPVGPIEEWRSKDSLKTFFGQD